MQFEIIFGILGRECECGFIWVILSVGKAYLDIEKIIF